jgi:predicted metalloprotease with PDZ domain
MLKLESVGATLVALSFGAAAIAQAPAAAAPRSADITNIRYEVHFDRQTAQQRRVDVSMSFDVAGTEPVLLSLPAWTPGAYEISNFARWVTDFSASASGAGMSPLTWDKLDYDTWRIQTRGAKSVTVKFTYVADSLDNAMAWSNQNFLLFNGTNLFFYPEGRSLAFPAQVTIRTEPDWRIATGMQSRGAPNARTYGATNYHDLVDMPFFVGRFDVDSAQIAGKWVRFASYPEGSVSGVVRTNVWDWLKRAIPAEAAVFGEVPWDTYTVMQIADSSYAGASGLEHQSSHVDVITPLAIQSEFMPSLYAHEIFHAWNVKRLRPAEMWPYVYDREQPTPWLWLSEGVTDYYADLAEVRGGIVDDKGFYMLTGGKMNEVQASPPVSLEDASLNTWIHPVDGSGYIYYQKGSLAGLLLDIMIRDASDNRHSLDDVMRELYTTAYKAGRGFTADDFWGAVTRASSGKSYADFRSRYIDGREPMPYESVLSLAGLHTFRAPTPRLGVTSQPDSGGVRVSEVDPGSAAAEAGVKVGDYLVAVGNIEVADQEFGVKFRAQYGTATEGTSLPIKVKRGMQTLTLNAKLRFSPGEYRVEPVANATAKQVKIREGILKGTTTK